MGRTVHKTCNLCEAGCGLLIEVESNHVVRLRADEGDPISRGHICPKAIALQEVQEDPDRLRRPLRRTRDGWQEISWDEALHEVAANLARIQLRDGDDAVGMYLGNPGAHNFGTVAYITALRRALRTRNQYTASSCDQNPKHAASLYLFGNVFKIAVPDIDRSDFLLVLGANPMVSNGSLMTAPGIGRRLRALRERGGRLVVIDPRRTATAALADQHFFIRPGSDAFLLASLVHVVLAEGIGRESHLEGFVTGEAELERLVSRFPPEAVAQRVGIPAAEIRFLAREFASARSAACYGRVGTSLHPYGTLANWLVDVLNLVTGNLDRPGGVLHATPAVDLAELTERIPGGERGEDGGRSEWRTRVRGAPAFNGEQPVACLAEEILTPGAGQVRGMLTVAGNPVLSTPDGRELDRAFESLEYCAAIDIYCNETTRHAQVILPPTWSLEHANYEIVFHQFAVHNSAKWSPAVLTPDPDALCEWEILLELGLRIAEIKAGSAPTRWALRALRAGRRFFHPARVLDWMLRFGPRGDGFRPWRAGLRLRDLQAQPRGVDLGPLVPSLEEWLDERGLEIDLMHPKMAAELVRLGGALEGEAPSAGLVLIGRRDSRTNNSWLHNVPSSVKGRNRCTLLMHPEDARARGLASDERVRIRSRVGEVEAPLELSKDVMRGVVCLPHGWGHDRPGTQLRVAQAHAHVSFNDLSDAREIEPVVGNAILNGVPVEVTRA